MGEGVIWLSRGGGGGDGGQGTIETEVDRD